MVMEGRFMTIEKRLWKPAALRVVPAGRDADVSKWAGVSSSLGVPSPCTSGAIGASANPAPYSSGSLAD